MLKKTISLYLTLILAFGLAACGNGTTDPVETIATVTTESANICETAGHVWTDATYQTPKTCTVCAAAEGNPLEAYFTQCGLEEKLLDKSGEYDFVLPCGTEPTKSTVAKVTASDYKTVASDDTHEALEGYTWKILSLKLHFFDENAKAYGLNMGKYLWDDRYTGGQNRGEDDIIDELFAEGMAYPITWNGVQYNGGRIHIAETVSGWTKDESGAYYLDIFVTVSARVPIGYDGFVFGLENPNWEWPNGVWLHEVLTDNGLLFCFD